MIKLNIDVKKINKEHLYEGKKGTYLNLVLFENRDGVDEYGNSGFVTQEVYKEDREAGVKGPILGNWKELGKGNQKPKSQPPTRNARQNEPESDDIPF